MPQAATLTRTSPLPGVGSGSATISKCLYSESKSAFIAVCYPFSERDSPLPGNKIVLAEQFSFCASFPAGDLNHTLEYLFSHLLDVSLAGDDAACVDINDVRHALRKIGIGRDFQYRGDRIARGRAQARRKQNHICTGSDLRRDRFHVAPRRTLQVQSRLGAVFRIVYGRRDGRCAAFLSCSRG